MTTQQPSARQAPAISIAPGDEPTAMLPLTDREKLEYASDHLMEIADLAANMGERTLAALVLLAEAEARAAAGRRDRG